jgi:hypothetical protein
MVEDVALQVPGGLDVTSMSPSRSARPTNACAATSGTTPFDRESGSPVGVVARLSGSGGMAAPVGWWVPVGVEGCDGGGVLRGEELVAFEREDLDELAEVVALGA